MIDQKPIAFLDNLPVTFLASERNLVKRPNFLIISSDQHRADCIGVEGRGVRTPHLDELCGDGTRFSAAICPSVVCQPARASILTGQLCRTHGVHDNGIDLDPATGEKGFAGALAAEGYETSFFGKAHFSTNHTRKRTGTPESVLSSDEFGPDWFGPYMGFSHVELMLLGHNWFAPEKPPRGLHYERFYHADGRGDEKQDLYWKNGKDTKGAGQCWHSQLPLAWHNTPWTADRAIEWLKYGRRNNKPFCTWVSFPDPHHPFDCPDPWSRMYDPDDIALPQHRSRDFDNRPWWHRPAMDGVPDGPAEEVELRTTYSRLAPQSDAQLREIIANTFGQISLIDSHIGRLLNALAAAGLDEHTYVIYIADHGDWLGDHGLILKGPMFYEGLLRVPMIIRGPDVPKGHVVDQPVSTIDIGPTLFDYARAKAMLTQHGQSLRPLIENADAKRDFAMSEWELLPTRVGTPLSLRSVRTRTHKLTMDMRSGAGEMYDLKNDKDEMQNLFNDPMHQEVQAILYTQLLSRPSDYGPIREQVGTA